MKNLLIICLAFLFICSCSKENSQVIESDFNSKEQLLRAPLEIQKQFWIDRMDLLIKLDLSAEHNNLLSIIKMELYNLPQNEFYLNDEIINPIIEVARITSEKDFIEIFESFELILNKLSPGNICLHCIDDLMIYEQLSGFPEAVINIETRSDIPAFECNCRWNCSGDTDSNPCTCTVSECRAGQKTNCCYGTNNGCGLFFLWSCNSGDILHDGCCD